MICKPIPKTDEFELVEPLVFWVDKKRQEVPVGFRFRGSVPKIFWGIIVSPYDPKCLRGFCIHDYLYDTHLCSRDSADKKLKRDILNDGLDKESAEMIYSMVDLFGKRAWKKGGK